MADYIVPVSRVYGVSNSFIDSYVSRKNIDEKFEDGLLSGKHIIIYGSSKQGKTSLIKNNFPEDKSKIIECSPKTQVIDIYKSLIRQLNVEIEESHTLQKGKELNGKVGLKAKLKIPFFGSSEASIEASGKINNAKTTQFKRVEYDLSLAQDISEVIEQCAFDGRVIVENFHYLSLEVQRSLAYDLRTFEEKRIFFVILGVWRERNRLTQFNGDLLDRLVEIPVEPWEKEDFEKVIKEGEPVLNVSFNNIKDRIIEKANGSIGVLQELCKYTCLKAGVSETMPNSTIELNSTHLNQAIQDKVSHYSSRHIGCLENFIAGDETKLNLPYYFLMAIFEFDIQKLDKGLKKSEVEEKMNALRDDQKTIRKNDFNRFFNRVVVYQINKDISPPIFDFDKGKQTIKIIDSTFIFFIANKDRKELMDCFCKPE